MRIIGGKFKGKSIQFIKSVVTRPLKDSVKESIFNILAHSKQINIDIKKARVIDLYSGIGSFGIECLSRDAKEVTFVEKDNKAIEILKQNLKKISINNQVTVINDKIENMTKKNKKRYNIFFFDPPFKTFDFIKILQIIKDNKSFYSDHIIIIHREKNTEESFEDVIEVLTIRYYGRSKIVFGKFK